MKNSNKKTYQDLLKYIIKPLFMVMALSLSMSSYLYANTWVDCGSENETCDIQNYASANFTTRYGVDGTYTYRYNQQGATLTCGLSTFAEDPAPGQVKRCAYSLNSPNRSTSINVLHSLMADEYDHNDHDQVVAHMLSESESLYSKNRQHRLKLNSRGKIQLHSLIDSKWTKRWSKGNSGNRGSSSDMYQFYVTPRGLAIRKNGSIDWVLYDSNTLGEDRNYILYLTNRGVLNLVDMDDTKFSIRISAGGESSAPRTSVSEAAIESLWNRAGWDHTDDWVASDHTNFRYLRRGLSHWHAHTVFEDINKISAHYKDEPTDMWDEVKTVFGDIIDDPSGKQGVKNIVNQGKNAKEVFEIVTNVSKIIDNLYDDTIPIEDKLQYKLFKTFETEINGLVNEEFMPEALGAMADTIEETNENLGRRLQADSNEPNCKRLCRYLSADHDVGKRVDYAVEIAPTAIGKALVGANVVGPNMLNQLQFRLFLTHVTVDGDGTRHMEFRIRLLDVSGVFLSKKFTTDYVTTSLSPTGVLDAIAFHDIVVPVSWKKKGLAITDFQFLEPRYQAFTGLTGELDVDFTANDHDVLAPHGVAPQLVNQIAPAIEFAEFNVTTIVDVDTLEVTTVNGANAAAVVQEAITTPSRYNNKHTLGFEGGGGIGLASIYHLTKLAEMSGSNTQSTEFEKILLTEALTGSFVIGAGSFAQMKLSTAEAWKASLSSVNLELIAGGMLGDVLYTLIHRGIHGTNDAIKLVPIATGWAAAKIGLGTNATTASANMTEYFNIELKSPPRFRLQFNWDFVTRLDLTTIITGNPDDYNRRLHEYGSYQLRTKHDKCLGLSSDLVGIVQETCQYLRHVLQANLTGEGEFYEIRNMFDGKCIGIPDNAYGADGIVGNGVFLKSLECDAVEDSRAVRWNANYIGLGNKLMLKSALDPNVCMDLRAGSSSEGNSFRTFKCNRVLSRQHFDIIPRSGVRDTTSGHTIRMQGDFCVDNEANSDDPNIRTAFNVQRCLTHGINRQNFRFTSKGNGFYQINIMGSNKYLDVSDESEDNNHIVHAWTSHGADNQQWKPLRTTDGSVLLKARHSDKCLALSTNGSTKGKLVQNSCNANNIQQQFYISNERFGAYDGYNTNPDKPDSFGPSNKNPKPGKAEIIGTKQRNTQLDNESLYGSHLAVDGKTSGDPAEYSTAINKSASKTWWQADMGGPTRVDHVTLYNTTGGGAYRLKNFYILITNTDVEGMTLTQARNAAVHELYVDHQVPGEVNNNSERFDLGAASGRYLVIYKESVSHLHLAEVVVETPPRFVDAKQRNTHQDDVEKKGPLEAIDGNTSGDPSAYTQAITYSASNSWWQGDMGIESELDGVTLYNTTGGGAYRLQKFYILVTNTDVEGMTLAQARNAAVHEVYVADQVPGLANNNSERFDLAGAKGRYLVIYKESVSHLHLAEVVPD